MPYFLRTTVTYAVAPNIYTHEYAVFDVDGDHDQDIIFARSKFPFEDIGNPIVFLLNDGAGSFVDGTNILFPSGAPTTVHPRGIAIADYNGDGRLDMFIADHGYDVAPSPGAQNTLLLSSGTNGVVDASTSLPQLSDYSHSTAAGDIDGDGDSDILVMNIYGGTPASGTLTNPYILVNNGAGNFVRNDDLLPASVENRDSGSRFTACLFFDADGDGDQDLFVGAHRGDSVSGYSRILFNDGTGNFSAAPSLALPNGPWDLANVDVVSVNSADLNGDGRTDLIVDFQYLDQFSGHYIQLLINDGAGGFVDETTSRMPQSTERDGRWIHSVQTVDLNGDGHVDLIARNGQHPPIFLNDGTGNFVNLPASFLDYEGWGTPWGVNLFSLDANGDSRTDLAADFGNGTIFLFTQQDPGPSQTGTESADAMLGDSDNETLPGLGGDDVIFGGAGADLITGGAGVDTMVGGAGADLYIDSATGLTGDTIRGLEVGDRIIITNAALTGFAFSVTGSTLAFTGGSITLVGGVSGTLIATAAIGGGVQLTISPDVRSDFNGDGRSDILWRNVDGQMSNWLGQANGGFVPNNANAAAVVPVAWQIVGTGDFNGDGRDDILWRHTDGTLSNWLATAAGGYTANDANAAVVVPLAWHVVGTGDFNGDGRDDILWRNNDGTLSNWLGQANGGFVANDANAAAPVPTAWHVAGTGDFDGDGRDDILWRNDDGQLSNWLGTANGGFTPNNANAAAVVPVAWQIIGIGDFNGDGRDDILWRNTDGTLSNWLATSAGGYTANDSNAAVFVPLDWSVVATGDYNGDGRDDILWRHTDGTLSNWLGNAAGGFTPNDAIAAAPVPIAWHVQPESFLL